MRQAIFLHQFFVSHSRSKLMNNFACANPLHGRHTPMKWRLDFNRDNAECLPVRESSNHCPDFEPLLIYGLQLTCHCSTTLRLWRGCGGNSDLHELMPLRIS